MRITLSFMQERNKACVPRYIRYSFSDWNDLINWLFFNERRPANLETKLESPLKETKFTNWSIRSLKRLCA